MRVVKPSWVMHQDDKERPGTIFSLSVHLDGSRLATAGLDTRRGCGRKRTPLQADQRAMANDGLRFSRRRSFCAHVRQLCRRNGTHRTVECRARIERDTRQRSGQVAPDPKGRGGVTDSLHASALTRQESSRTE